MMKRIIKAMALMPLITMFAKAEDAQAETEAKEEQKGHEWDWQPTLLNEETFKAYVVDYSDENAKMVSDKPWFIKFFAPWCGHCKRLAPIWTEFNKLHQSEINVGAVDCTDADSKPVCSAMEVQGYPTLLYFPTST